jgi:hypothetical protein
MADTGQVDVKRLWEMAKSGMPKEGDYFDFKVEGDKITLQKTKDKI